MTSPSPTQRRLEPSDVERLVAASFGPRREVAAAGPMTGGGFAAVWWVTLGGGEIGGGETVVLKVAPAADVPLLSYERALLAAEAHYYRLVERCAPEVPLPTVLRYGSDPGVLDSDWMFMTRLAGRSLSELRADQPPADQPPADDTPVRRDLGAALASLHAVTGPRFGYDGGRVSGPNWRRVFAEMIDELLSDARSWQVELPAAPARIRESVERHAVLLDQVERPALVHFDTWDGNVLAAPSLDGGLRLTGLVDGERYLYGDPVMDLVSAALYRRSRMTQTIRCCWATAAPLERRWCLTRPSDAG